MAMRTITVCTVISASVFALTITPRAVTLLSAPLEGPDPSLVSADAAWLVHLDLERALETRLGRLLFDAGAARMDFDASGFGGNGGIDPMREIKRITAYGFNAEGGPGVMILEATPAIDLIVEKLKGEHGEVTADQIDGYEVLRWDQGVASIRTIGLGGRMIVLGPEAESLVAALRVIDDEMPSLADVQSSPLAGDMRAGTFLSVEAPDVGVLRQELEEAAQDVPEVLKVAKSISLQLGEADGVSFLDSSFATPSKEDSSDIADVAQGLMAMARMMLRDEPELAEFEPLLRAITIRAEGAAVRLLFEMPAEALPEPAGTGGADHESGSVGGEDDEVNG